MKNILIISVLVFLSACSQTRFEGYQTQNKDTIFDRTVSFQVENAYYTEMPSCVMVMPLGVAQLGRLPALNVEQAVARQISDHFDRVIGPAQRSNYARTEAFDENHPDDQRRMAQNMGCDYAMQIKALGAGGSYNLVIARQKIGLELILFKVQGKLVLWKARHTASRWDGGLPLSPLSFITGAIAATRLNTDQDLPSSLLDDALRRMVVTLPNLTFSGPQKYITLLENRGRP